VRWEIAGVAMPPAVASALAPATVFKNVRRSMMCLIQHVIPTGADCAQTEAAVLKESCNFR
jgi:hypothetical protein